jgi:hypothetical protein
MGKGIILSYLCLNPSCEFSEKQLIIKNPLTSSSNGSNHKFSGISSCPKCKSAIELLTFVSGTIEIVEDNI